MFSLLGMDGYEYVEDEALKDVRRQILKPGEVFIPKFSTRTPEAWPRGYGIVLSRELPCWGTESHDGQGHRGHRRLRVGSLPVDTVDGIPASPASDGVVAVATPSLVSHE